MAKKKDEEVVKDATELRKDRCEPIAKEMLDVLLKNDLLLTDVDFIEQLVKEQFEQIMKHIVFLHANDVFQLVTDSLNFALSKAREEHWGKEGKDITVGDVEKVLVDADQAKKNQ